MGKQSLGGHKQNLGAPGPRREEQWPHKRLTQSCPWVSRSLQWRCGLAVSCCRVRGTEWGSACMEPFDGGRHYLHYLHHSLASGQTTGREHSPTHQQKIELKIYWAWPNPSEQDPVSPSVSLSHQEASISLLSLFIRGQTEENHNHRKLTKLITWIIAFSHSVKLWAMLCRATQDGWVMVDSSDKMCSTGERKRKVKSPSRPTLCDPMDCSPTRLLCPWDSPGKNTGVGSFSRGSSQPRNQTQVSCIASRFFTSWATTSKMTELSLFISKANHSISL